MQQAVRRIWAKRGWVAIGLWPLSCIYAILVRLRRLAFRVGLFESHRVPTPVVVIGNVVVGGAGKTPVVIALAKHLQQQGHRVGIVSRGYGRHGEGCVEVRRESSPDACGDEPLLVKRALGLPVFVSRNRVEAARRLLAAWPDTSVILSDDGLQHLALCRDVEICLFDDQGIGNGFMLPAGPLREPWPRPMDLILDSAPNSGPDRYHAARQLAHLAVRADGTTLSLDALNGTPVTAVAAIANPDAFFTMLRARGVQLLHAVALPDHHDFHGWVPPGSPDTPLVFTEKDATKLWATYPGGWAVPLEVTLDPEFLSALDQMLTARLSLSPTHPQIPCDG